MEIHPKKTEALARQFLELAAKHSDEDGEGALYLITGPAATVRLLGEAVNELDALRKEVWSIGDMRAYVSEEQLKKTVHGLLSQIRAKPEEAESLLLEELARLEKAFIERVAYVPLFGVKLEIEKYEIGRVTLKSLSEEEAAGVAETVSSIALAALGEETVVEANAKIIEKQVREALRIGTCSILRAVGEPQKVFEIAETETRRALDLIRFSIPALYPARQRVNVSLAYELSTGFRNVPVIATDGSSFALHANRAGPLRPYVFTNKTSGRLDDIGVSRLSELLRKPRTSLTGFEKALLRSVHWFASAYGQEEPENALLNLITSLEVLFTPRDRSPIATSVAESAALVFGEDLESRLEIKRLVLARYNDRNKISHGGRLAVEESEVEQLMAVVGEVLVRMVERLDEFRSREAIAEWLEHVRLS